MKDNGGKRTHFIFEEVDKVISLHAALLRTELAAGQKAGERLASSLPAWDGGAPGAVGYPGPFTLQSQCKQSVPESKCYLAWNLTLPFFHLLEQTLYQPPAIGFCHSSLGKSVTLLLPLSRCPLNASPIFLCPPPPRLLRAALGRPVRGGWQSNHYKGRSVQPPPTPHHRAQRSARRAGTAAAALQSPAKVSS